VDVPLPLPGAVVAPSTFVRANGDLAVFNYGPLAKRFDVNLSAVGFSFVIDAAVKCYDAWDRPATAVRTC